MLLAERVEEIAGLYGGEVPLPAGPAPGALNELWIEAYRAHYRDIVFNSPALVVPLGSICTKPNAGNALKFSDPQTGRLARDFYHDTVTGESVNSIGLKQFGIEEALYVLPDLAKIAEHKGKILKVSVSSLGDEDASVVLPELMERVFEMAGNSVTEVTVEANLGCPNKVDEAGGRHPVLAQDELATEITLTAIKERLGEGLSYGPKLSYYKPEEIDGVTDYHKLKRILGIVARIGSDFVSLSNTEIGVKLTMPDGTYALDNIPGNVGGGSGPAHRESGYQQLLVARKELPDSIDIVSTNGVYDGAEVRRRELAGAVFSEMVTRLWVESEREGISYGDVLRRVYQEYINAREAEASA